MNARDVLRDQVSLVLEMNRYKKALRQIVSMKDDRDTHERDARDLGHAVAVAENALAKRKKGEE